MFGFFFIWLPESLLPGPPTFKERGSTHIVCILFVSENNGERGGMVMNIERAMPSIVLLSIESLFAVRARL